MINLLPAPKTSKLRALLQSKKFRYKIAALLDLLLIIFLLINGRQPAQRMISPMVSSINNIYQQVLHRTTAQSFAFVPGLAQNKFSDIDLENLAALSFFDVPLTEDAQVNENSRGFASFTSDATAELFDRARYHRTRIFLTLTSSNKDTIAYLLNNKEAQEKLASQATALIRDYNIGGISIDFELSESDKRDQQLFTDFINFITKTIHANAPSAQVAVAVPSSLIDNQSLYNLESLSKVSDVIFLIASNMIVPEIKNAQAIKPMYGFSENEYWSSVSNLLGNLFKRAPSQKIVMERAWYGNGDRYPLYTPSTEVPAEDKKESQSIALDSKTINKLAAGVPAKGREAAKRNIPLIAKALAREGILDTNVLAYALATIEHETDETFEPIEEIQGRFSARRLGYEGGMNYFGRGFIQITHLRNYKAIGQRIGMGDELVKHPELASDPDIAAKILAAFFKDNNVANLASQGYFVAARRPINPDYNGYSVARLAYKYEL